MTFKGSHSKAALTFLLASFLAGNPMVAAIAGPDQAPLGAQGLGISYGSPSFEAQAFTLQLRYVRRLLEPFHTTFAATRLPRKPTDKLTSELQAHYRQVKSLLDEGLLDEVMKEIQNEVGDLKPIGGRSDPRGRLLAMTNGVAETTRQAAGHPFDLVVYPASGSDLLSAAAFSDRVITITAGTRLFSPWTGDRDKLKKEIKTDLKEKLLDPIHAGYQIRTMTDYALELFLLGVDADSIQVSGATRLSKGFWFWRTDQGAFKTTVRFQAGGRSFEHTHLQWFLPTIGEEPNPAKNHFFQAQLSQLLKGHDRIILLSKGCAPGVIFDMNALTSTFTLYPLLPVGTVVVADGPTQKRSVAPYADHMRLTDLKTAGVRQDLDALDGPVGAEGVIKLSMFDRESRRILHYGYARRLSDIAILKLERFGSAVSSTPRPAWIDFLPWRRHISASDNREKTLQDFERAA